MRVLTNEQLIRRNRTIAQVLFIVSLVILIGGLIVTNTIGRDTTLLTLVPCLVMPVGLITTWFSVRLTNQYVRLPHPEDAVQAGLKGSGRGTVLYNYLFKADHVFVCPQGVYAIVTRFQDGLFRVQGETITNTRTRGILGRWMTFMRQEQLGDPFKDARTAAADLQARIDEALPNEGITVQPVVVFVSEKVALEIENPAIPVVLANPKKKPSLRSLIRDPKKRADKQLTPAQIAKIQSALNADLAIEETDITDDSGDDDS